MCCCDGKTRSGCGTVSRVFLSIFNILLLLIQLAYLILILILYSSFAGPLIPIPIVVIIICSIGCSATCCPNKIALIVYAVLMAIICAVHLIVFIIDVTKYGVFLLGIVFLVVNPIFLVLELFLVILSIIVVRNLQIYLNHNNMPTIQYSNQPYNGYTGSVQTMYQQKTVISTVSG